MKRDDINIRDPFVLPYNGKYYMYGTRGSECWTDEAFGLDVYVSEDLENWNGPKEIFRRGTDFWATKNYWAPEVYEYNGAFYMFVSLKSETEHRGTFIFKADAPDSEFKPYSERITPADWECLDGTLYISKAEIPYMIFCHEWTQIKNGQICAIELAKDLKSAVGEPKVLITASDAPWIKPAQGNDTYVTDGPFVMRLSDGELIMLWSSFGEEGYTEAISRSSNKEIDGVWTHDEKLLFKKDGGHGMVFRAFDGRLILALHSPNVRTLERPCFYEIKENNGTLEL